MRTKTLLLSAAVGAVGLLAADAQVYSVNSVGYVNLTIPPGFSTFANQLINPNNTIEDLFPNPVPGMKVFVWTGNSFNPIEAIDVGGGTVLWDNGAQTLDIGVGYFIENPTASDISVTLVGEVPQGADSNVTFAPGFNLVSSTVPMSGVITTAMDFPTSAGDRIFIWTGTAYTPSEAIDVGGGTVLWDSDPAVAVGEGFFVDKKGNYDWVRNFSVNQ